MRAAGPYLVVGVDGMLGGALRAALEATGAPTLGTALQPDAPTPGCLRLDLAESVARWPIPDAVSTAFLGAAITSLEACRADPAWTRRINVEGTVRLARLLLDQGAFVIFPSTNLVFDGSASFRRADERPNPQTEYGRQKAEVEAALLVQGRRVAVVRFTKVLAPRLRLLSGWRAALRAGAPVHPFHDMVMSPVPLTFVTQVLLSVAAQQTAGILQVSGAEDVTYAQAARRLADRLGAAPDLVQPISARDAGLPPEWTPPHTTLDTSRLCGDLGLSAPDPWAALDSCVDA